LAIQSQSIDSTAAPAVAPADDARAGSTPETWVLFTVDGQMYALQLAEVERVVRAVQVMPLPETPAHIAGVVNVHGRVLPVVDLRARFGGEPSPMTLDNQFVIAKAGRLSLIVIADQALGTREAVGGLDPEDNEIPRCVRKVLPLEQGVVYSLDLERVLFGDESPTDSELAQILVELQTP